MPSNGDPTPGEIGRSLQRIETRLSHIEEAQADEQSRQRHRVNNLEQIIAAQKVYIDNSTRRMDKLEESLKWAFRMLASAFVGLVIQAGFLVLVR